MTYNKQRATLLVCLQKKSTTNAKAVTPLHSHKNHVTQKRTAFLFFCAMIVSKYQTTIDEALLTSHVCLSYSNTPSSRLFSKDILWNTL